MSEAIVEREKRVKLRVLKPFVFTHPADEHTRVASESRFVPGIHEVPESVANHPWIQAGADGKIESAAQAAAREANEAARQKIADEDRARETAAAEAAVGRLARAEATTGTASAAEIEKQLNTPVNELKKQGPGAGVTAKPK